MILFALLSRHRRHLLEWLTYGGLLAAGAAGLLYLQRNELQRYEELETARLDNLASVVASNIQTDLDATNHALASVVRGGEGALANAAHGNAELAKLVSLMPGVRSMAVLNREGVIVASDQADVLGRSLAGRAYFQLARSHPDIGTLFVSAPFRSLRGDLVITLSRVIPAADGGFAGLALATLDPEYFIAKFRSARYAPDAWGYVVHGDGIQLLNYPVKSNIDGRSLNLPGSLFQRHRMLNVDASMQQGRVVTTGEMRLMALRTIQPPALRMDTAIVIGLSREVAAIALPLQAQARGFAVIWCGVAVAGALSLALTQRRRRVVQQLRDEQQSERQRLQAMAVSEQRFKTLIEDAPLPVAILRRGHFIYTNPRYRALHGYAPQDDLAGLPWRAMIAEQSRQALRREEALIDIDSPQEQTFEALGLGKAGRLIPVLKATARVALADGYATLVFAQDISAQKRAEAELTLARDEAEAASHAKADFLANMSHEIRSPLSAILGLAYLLERARLEGDAQDTVRKIRAAGQSLLGIINDILDVSKIEAGHMALEQAPFRLSELIAHVAGSMSVGVVDKPVELVVETMLGDVDMVLGDALRLQQVLTNLTSNAVKFTPAGKVVLAVRLLARDGDSARLGFSVLDTGIGIAPALHSEIFAPFSQADNSTTRRFGGTGLGLTISRQLVQLMGGELTLSSALGEGSEFGFVLTLPLAAEGQPDGDARPAAHVHEPVGCLQDVRVLVVDDSEINREVIERIVVGQGAIVSKAVDGQAALDCLASHPDEIDVVLMDIQMPVMDGIEATRRIRQLPQLRTLPIIALTAGALTSQKQAALAAGMNHFITKPFDVSAILACIRQVVKGRGLPTPSPASPLQAGSPESAAFDAGRGVALWRDEQRYHQVLRQFSRCYGGVVDAIGQRVAHGNVLGAAALAHQLAGASASLALEALCAQAQQVERLLHAGTSAGAPAALAALEPLLGRALAQIAALGPEPAGIAAPPPAAAPRLLAQLLAELPAADPTALDTLLQQLSAHIPAADVEALQARLRAFDFDGAASVARTLLAHPASAAERLPG